MIDTVRLGTSNFSLSDDHIMDDRSTQKHGYPRVERWRRNQGTLRTDVLPGWDGLPFLKVEVSAPKYLLGDSLHEVRESDLDSFMQKLTVDLEAFGIGTDVEKMGVSRADVCRNVHLSSDVSSFIEGCADFNIGRMRPHHWKGETILFENGTRSLEFYDKLLESAKDKLHEARNTKEKDLIKRAKADLQSLSKTTHNILRAESTAKNLRGVMRTFGGGSVSRVGRVNRVDPPVLADVWNEEKSRKILVADFDEMRAGAKGRTIPPHFDDLLKQLIAGREAKRRSIINDVVRQNGAPKFLHQCGGSVEGLRRLLLSAGFSRQTAYNQTRRLQGDIAAGVPLATFDLLAEVREKLAA